MTRGLPTRLLHFLAIGALLFVAGRRLSAVRESPPDGAAVRVGAVRAVEARWLAASGRLPRADELDRALPEAIDEELLFRTALVEGLHRSDAVVRRRLIQNQRFLTGDERSEGPALLADALALGFAESDVVVRRRLVERMRGRIAAAAHRPAPTEAELRAFHDRVRGSFREPARVRISHVFLRRGDDPSGERRRGQELAGALQQAAIPPAEAPALGDPFLLGHHLSSRSRRELASRFGAKFAQAVFALHPRSWSAPIASAYGLHLVWVHETRPGREWSYEQARGPTLALLLEERRARLQRSALEELRRRHALPAAGTP